MKIYKVQVKAAAGASEYKFDLLASGTGIKKDALKIYNAHRNGAGLQSLKKMPNGTIYYAQ